MSKQVSAYDAVPLIVNDEDLKLDWVADGARIPVDFLSNLVQAGQHSKNAECLILVRRAELDICRLVYWKSEIFFQELKIPKTSQLLTFPKSTDAELVQLKTLAIYYCRKFIRIAVWSFIFSYIAENSN